VYTGMADKGEGVEIGLKIRELRKKRGWTAGDVEHATGMHRAYISRIENGHTIPSLETIERFAATFDVPLTEIFGSPSGRGKTRPARPNAKSPLLNLLATHNHELNDRDRKILLALARTVAKMSRLKVAATSR
jgi:transcriptional regulator with XRE-family HTH domain